MVSFYRFVPFIASNGTEYELKLEFGAEQSSRVSDIERLVEDDRGRIRAEPGRWGEWDGLMEMTHELGVTIVSWAADSTN